MRKPNGRNKKRRCNAWRTRRTEAADVCPWAVVTLEVSPTTRCPHPITIRTGLEQMSSASLVTEAQGILAMLLGQEVALGRPVFSAGEQTVVEGPLVPVAVYLLSEKTVPGVVALVHHQSKKRRRRTSLVQMLSGERSASLACRRQDSPCSQCASSSGGSRFYNITTVCCVLASHNEVTAKH
jgi:hypothetical protein